MSFESAMFLGSITKALLVVSASVHSFFVFAVMLQYYAYYTTGVMKPVMYFCSHV